MIHSILLVLAVCWSGLVYSEERTYSGKIIVGDSSEYTYRNSSEVNRQPLQFALGVSSGRYRSSFFLGYYLNPDLMIELEQRRVRDDEQEGRHFYWLRDEDATAVDAKFFFKDAWMVSVGFLKREALYTDQFYFVDDWTHAYELQMKQRDYAARLTLSSQWQWSGFFIGFDWVSYETRMGSQSSSVSATLMAPERFPNNLEQRMSEARADAPGLNRKEVLSTGLRIGYAF